MSYGSSSRGFTMIEFILVVAISAILIVGLAAIIEVPRQMAEDEQTQSHVSSADRALAQLERDIRFCKDAQSAGPTQLEVTLRDGSTVGYAWDGNSGTALARTDSQGTSDLVSAVRALDFTIVTAPLEIRKNTEERIESTPMVVSSFDRFTVDPGCYVEVDGVASVGDTTGLSKTTQQPKYYAVGKYSQAGIIFRASGIDDAESVAIQLRLKRRDSRDLDLEVYGIAGSFQPDYGDLYATGSLANSAMPVTLENVVIPLTTIKKLVNGADYFVKLVSDYQPADVTGYAATVEYCVLDPVGPAQSDGVGFSTSPDWFTDFQPALGAFGNAAASSVLFQYEGTISESVTEDASIDVMQIPVAVALSLALAGPDGDQVVKISFPIENNIALVTQ